MINQEEKNIIIETINSGVKAMDFESEAFLLETKLTVMMTLDLYATDSQIEDMLGFVKWSKDTDQDDAFISSNLMHDINGISRADSPGFSPRTSGYSKFLKTEKPKMPTPPAWLKGMGPDFS